MPLSSRPRARPRARAARLAPTLFGVAVLPLAACGEDAVTPGAAPSPAPATALTVVWDPGEGGEGATWTLRCDPPRGDHPDPDGACADLAALPEPFAAPPEGRVCTEVYGGPQTARVTGTWRGEEVTADLDRTDGCGIARWDDLGRLLPTVAGGGVAPDGGSGAGG